MLPDPTPQLVVAQSEQVRRDFLVEACLVQRLLEQAPLRFFENRVEVCRQQAVLPLFFSAALLPTLAIRRT